MNAADVECFKETSHVQFVVTFMQFLYQISVQFTVLIIDKDISC